MSANYHQFRYRLEHGTIEYSARPRFQSLPVHSEAECGNERESEVPVVEMEGFSTRWNEATVAVASSHRVAGADAATLLRAF